MDPEREKQIPLSERYPKFRHYIDIYLNDELGELTPENINGIIDLLIQLIKEFDEDQQLVLRQTFGLEPVDPPKTIGQKYRAKRQANLLLNRLFPELKEQTH